MKVLVNSKDLILMDDLFWKKLLMILKWLFLLYLYYVYDILY